MAKVHLTRYEVEERLLPALCMKCGAAAMVDKKKAFAWHPPWVLALILFGVLPCAIVALILTKRMTVMAPLCDEHKSHWSWRSWFIGLGFAALVVLGIGAIALIAADDNRRGAGQQLGGLVCGATAVAGLIWLFAVAIIQQTAIRTTKITDRGITLTNVSRTFIDALEEDRARDQVDEDGYPYSPKETRRQE